ncbi:uncharacterized protein LOC128735374 [Sabethes cyaneus]|uniref:uncharacterized protein LOC128735374 n=1 Tax=Sabethes cyaneus TaxID=53552 RepID=UPI00237E08E8|nr:uncharacterized protein LOC128735374 [Sabethes cyaneus]
MDCNIDLNFFWITLEEAYGAINSHNKNILRIQNLCSQSLGRLTRENIWIIEEDMRGMAEHSGDKIQAYVTCSLCDESKSRQSKISLSMDATGSWHIFAFKRHCETFHIHLPRASKGKRHATTANVTDKDSPVKRFVPESSASATTAILDAARC